MNTRKATLPLSEPEVVHNLLLDGVTIIRNSVGGMRAVGWEAILDADGRLMRGASSACPLAAEAVARTLGEVRRLFWGDHRPLAQWPTAAV